MLSGWERGRHTTSRRYRTLLAGYYDRPVDELFTHQDGAATAKDAPHLVSGPRELREAMMEVARSASSHLAVAGSRSRYLAYLEVIGRCSRPSPPWSTTGCCSAHPVT